MSIDIRFMSDIKWGENRVVEYGVDQIEEVARFLLDELGDTSVWLFDAPMGAGKTTLIKELCHQL